MDTTVRQGTAPLRLDTNAVKIPAIDLVVVDGPCRGLRAHIPGDVARVGSAPFNHLVLQDATVSRAHCELRLRTRSISIKDCGSTNGTLVDGVRVRDADVRPGSSVRVGGSTFRIEASGLPLLLPVSERTAFGELLGASLEMRRVYATLERVAQSHCTLLIEGETGTGKEVAARALHAASSRREGPFVPVDCSAIPEDQFESELFGMAQSGADGSERRGAFEEAQHGTLFLDEIGEMPMSAQAKLLRALETRSVKPAGSASERPVDVRIVATSSRPLASLANAGTFREDLYYRLAVVELKLPPLRARSQDIPLLARHFHAQISGQDRELPQAYLRALCTRSFPGNVRELRSFIERSVSLGLIEGEVAAPSQSPPQIALDAGLESVVPLHLPLKDARTVWTQSFESIYVRSMLRKTGGNLTRAAQLSGVNRRFLQRLVARLGIRNVHSDDERDLQDP